METIELDLKRQKEAKEYSRISRRMMIVDLIMAGIYALAWLVFGWSVALETWFSQYTTNPWFLVLLFTLVFGGIYTLIGLPLSYYSGFILPHRFGQSNQTMRDWVLDEIKGLAVGGVIGLILLEVIYAVLRAYPDTWWIWTAVILLIFSVILANLAPVLIMPIFNKFIPLGEEHQELIDRLVRLFEQAGTRVKGVFKFDMSRRTKSANAALTGLGSTRRIILGDTLLSEFTTDEIETVLAHELGHHVNRDIPLLMVIQTISTIVGLWLASIVLNWGVNYFGLSSPSDIASLPLFMLVLGFYELITMPLTNAVSRWRERKADRYALEATDNPQAFISAMTRLANQNLAEVDPEPWVEFLLHSHPSLEKRIKMAEQYGLRGKS